METRNESHPCCWSELLIRLYQSNFEKLVNVAQRILHDRGLAEECVQDVFMAYHLKKPSPAAGHELGYLRSMVRNRAISSLRREQRHRQVALSGAVPIELSAEARAVASLMADHISSRLGDLAPRQGAVVAHRLLGLSVAETAREMSVTSGTVKTHRHRAAQAMRTSLGTSAAA